MQFARSSGGSLAAKPGHQTGAAFARKRRQSACRIQAGDQRGSARPLHSAGSTAAPLETRDGRASACACVCVCVCVCVCCNSAQSSMTPFGGARASTRAQRERETKECSIVCAEDERPMSAAQEAGLTGRGLSSVLRAVARRCVTSE